MVMWRYWDGCDDGATSTHLHRFPSLSLSRAPLLTWLLAAAMKAGVAPCSSVASILALCRTHQRGHRQHTGWQIKKGAFRQ